MAAKLYRVVETTWDARGRVEHDIGLPWRQVNAAKTELNIMRQKNPRVLYSLQTQK